MGWIILEGLDRTGKSTLAKIYEKQGYDLVHMSAPDKKFVQPGYAGPSYLDEIMDIYMRNNARDVVFDRSPYGENVWPFVYGRKTQLTEDDLEILREIEDTNQAQRILMFDSDVAAHWKRCVDNKEPLNKNQFNQANLFFDRMAAKYDFKKLQLPEVLNGTADYIAPVMTEDEQKRLEKSLNKNSIVLSNSATVSGEVKLDNTVPVTGAVTVPNTDPLLKASKTPQQFKLDKANAINDILSKKILKQKGVLYDEIENELRNFLNDKLGTIMGSSQSNSLSKEEVEILKVYCQQIKKKMESK